MATSQSAEMRASSAKVQRLVDEIYAPKPPQRGVKRTLADLPPHVAELIMAGESDDFETLSQTFCQHDPAAEHEVFNASAARARLEYLMSRLHTEERHEVLTTVSGRLRNRAATASRELVELERLDQLEDYRFHEMDVAAKELMQEVSARETTTLGNMQDFHGALSILVAEKKRKAAEAAAASEEASSEQAALVADDQQSSEQHAGSVVHDDDLPEAIELLEAQVKQQEEDLLGLLQAAAQAEGISVDEEAEDVVAEAEKLVVYTKETVRQNDQRSKLLKELMDNMMGKVTLGEDGEPMELSQGAISLRQALQEEIEQRVLPVLVEQREQEYGEELRACDESELIALREECDHLEKCIAAVEAVAAKVTSEEALASDINAKLEAVSRLEAPGPSELDGTIEALRSLGPPFKEDAWTADDELIVTDAGGEVGKQVSVRPMEVIRVDEELKEQMRQWQDVEKELVKAVLNAASDEVQAQKELGTESAKVAASQEALDLLVDHETLLSNALALARGLPLKGSPSPWLQEVQSSFDAASWSSSAAAAVAATATPLHASGDYDEEVAAIAAGGAREAWMDAFFAEEDDGFEPDPLHVQAEVLRALESEEARLEAEVQQLQSAFDRRVSDLKAGGELPPQMVDELTVGAADCAKTVEALHGARRKLVGVGVTKDLLRTVPHKERRKAAAVIKPADADDGSEGGSSSSSPSSSSRSSALGSSGTVQRRLIKAADPDAASEGGGEESGDSDSSLGSNARHTPLDERRRLIKAAQTFLEGTAVVSATSTIGGFGELVEVLSLQKQIRKLQAKIRESGPELEQLRLQARKRFAMRRPRADGSGFEEAPGVAEARKLRRECRALAAVRAEVRELSRLPEPPA